MTIKDVILVYVKEVFDSTNEVLLEGIKEDFRSSKFIKNEEEANTFVSSLDLEDFNMFALYRELIAPSSVYSLVEATNDFIQVNEMSLKVLESEYQKVLNARIDDYIETNESLYPYLWNAISFDGKVETIVADGVNDGLLLDYWNVHSRMLKKGYISVWCFASASPFGQHISFTKLYHTMKITLLILIVC